MQYIGKLDSNKLGKYKDKIITTGIVLTDERLYKYILIEHNMDYKQPKDYSKDIIENPDIILEDNKNINTIRELFEVDKFP